MHATKTAIALALTALVSPLPLLAQGSKVTSPIELARAASQLKAGEWVWAPEISPEGPVIVYVDLSRQVADVYRNGVRIGVSTVSSGKPGHETPTGVFTILQKDKNHHSSTYNNAPMPFQQRLTWDGVALHAGGLPGYPESHGCVHLPYAFANELFAITSMGGTVVVQGHAGSPTRIPAVGVLAPVLEGGMAVRHDPLPDGASWTWTPDLSAEGPVSLVLSTTDREVVVLRNGVEIGRARAEFSGGDTGTHLATLGFDQDRRPHWMLVALPGHANEQGHAVDATIMERLRLPQPFLERVQPLLAAGTHVLITPARIDIGKTGSPLTVLAAND